MQDEIDTNEGVYIYKITATSKTNTSADILLKVDPFACELDNLAPWEDDFTFTIMETRERACSRHASKRIREKQATAIVAQSVCNGTFGVTYG